MTAGDKPPLTPSEVKELIQELDDATWAKAERLAQFLASTLSGESGEDLLQEAVVLLLSGDRTFPRDVPFLIVMKNVMKSLISNLRKRRHLVPMNSLTPHLADVRATDADGYTIATEFKSDDSPEQKVEAQEFMDYVFKSIQGDEHVELVHMAWLDGLSGKDAAAELGISMPDYESAKKRLMRKLAALKPGDR